VLHLHSLNLLPGGPDVPQKEVLNTDEESTVSQKPNNNPLWYISKKCLVIQQVDRVEVTIPSLVLENFPE
jgi:hypothetical protein